jgi:hypothetical protein
MLRYSLLAGVLLFSAWGVSQAALNRAPDEVHEGKVISVTGDTIIVLDMADDDMDKFTVTSATMIKRNGKSAKISDIRAGDRAKVTAVQEGEKLVAKSIDAIAPE